MVRTVRTHTVTAKAIKYENGELIELDLDPIVYQGREMRDSGLNTKFNEQTKELGLEGYTILITEKKVEEQKFHMTLEKFIEMGTPVDMDFVDREEREREKEKEIY